MTPPEAVRAIDGEKNVRVPSAPQLPEFLPVNEVDWGSGPVEEEDSARGIGGF
jgi:hypothetical protein